MFKIYFKEKSYDKSLRRTVSDLMGAIEGKPYLDFIFDRDSFESKDVPIEEYYNDLVDFLRDEGYGLSSILNDHSLENPDMFDYTYTLDSLDENLSESISPAEAQKVRDKSDAHAVLYGYKFYDKEFPLKPEEHDEESLRKRIEEIIDSHQGEGKRNGKRAYEKDFIFYVLYPRHKNMNEGCMEESKKEDFIEKLERAIHDYYVNDREYDEEEYKDSIKDYLNIQVKPYTNREGGWGTYVLVGAELSYSGFERLIENCLDPFVQQYDEDAYFEMEDPGLASAIIWKKNLVEGKEELSEGRMSDIDILIQDAGGDIHKAIKDNEDYRDELFKDIDDLNTIERKYAGRGGNFDSLDDLERAVSEKEKKIAEVEKDINYMKSLIKDEDMKIINTNKLIEAVEEIELEPRAHVEVPIAQGAAMKSSEMFKKHFDEVIADKEKEAKDLNNSEKDRVEPKKIERSEGSKKLHLEESLFEAVDSNILESQESSEDFEPFFFKDDEDNFFRDEASYWIDNLKVSDYIDEYDSFRDFVDNEFSRQVLGSQGNPQEMDELYKYFTIKSPKETKIGLRIWKEDTKESLTEADSIRVKTLNFRPTGEEATATYSRVEEVGKLEALQDLIDQMYPDEEQVSADELNRLLSEKSKWVLDMLNIPEVED